MRTCFVRLPAVKWVDHARVTVAEAHVDDSVFEVKLHQLFVGEWNVVHVMAVTAVTLFGAAAECDVHIALDLLYVYCAGDLTAGIVRIFLTLTLET